MGATFPASLDTRGRLVTWLVGYGVGMGVPTVLAVSLAVGLSEPWLLLFPIPFIVAFGIPWFFRPLGFAVDRGELLVLRPIGPLRFPLDRLADVVRPSSRPPGPTLGLARVSGIHGTFGTVWNRSWGRYRVYVTNPRNAVELRFDGGGRTIVSPDDPDGFVEAVRSAAAEASASLGREVRIRESEPTDDALSGRTALILVESAVLLIALILPFTPSKTGRGFTEAADWLFDDPTYLANVVVGFLMANAVMGVIGVIVGVLARRE